MKLSEPVLSICSFINEAPGYHLWHCRKKKQISELITSKEMGVRKEQFLLPVVWWSKQRDWSCSVWEDSCLEPKRDF